MSLLRVEQWSATQAQPPAFDSFCTITNAGPGKPSLLDTLKAAAQEAALQAARRKAPLAGNLLTSPDLCPRPHPTAQEAPEASKTGIDAPPLRAASRATESGKLGLAPLLLKKAGSKGSRANAAVSCDSPVSPQTATAAGSATFRFVHKARNELAKLEMDIPWEAVLQSWKLQRAHWRKTLRQAESVSEITDAMRELRNALSIPGSPFSHYGGAWDQLLDRCCQGSAALDDLSQLLSELKTNARAWIKVREQQTPEIAEEQQTMALRGLEALWQAVREGPTALAQCPLEAILGYSEEALQALRELLQREIDLQITSAAMGGEEVGKRPMGSIFATLQDQRLCVSSSVETASESLMPS